MYSVRKGYFSKGVTNQHSFTQCFDSEKFVHNSQRSTSEFLQYDTNSTSSILLKLYRIKRIFLDKNVTLLQILTDSPQFSLFYLNNYEWHTTSLVVNLLC